jgi:filamentous hemagglutinin family protein
MPLLRPIPLLGLALALAAAAPSTAQSSQISLDGSLPHGRTDVLTGPGTGPDYVVSEDLGWRSGANLFHSFWDLSIATGESATFTANAGSPALANVIARVTGGNPSAIDGRLALDDATLPTADFYLFNPHGVFFGGESSVDVPGSFYVSTAHQLGFGDGDEQLDLLNREAPVLSADPPASFGFVAGGPRAEVVFSNPLPQAGTRDYAVTAGHAFSVIAGDVRVENNVTLRAPSGRVQLAAVGSATGEIPLDFAVPLDAFGAPAALGEVRISADSQVLAVNANRNLSQGCVVIRGGRFALESGSDVRAGGFTGVDGPAIDIAVSRDVVIDGSGTQVRAEVPGALPGGGVGISADTIAVSNGALVQTRADAAQAGGDLVLAAREIHLTSRGTASTLTNRQGAGGDVLLSADLVEIDGGQVQSFAGAPGAGGSLLIASDSLRIVNGTIGTESSATGPGGDIQIDAETVVVEGVLAQISTSNAIAAAPEPTIPGGSIRIGSEEDPATRVLVADGGLISTQAGVVLPTGRVGAQPGGDIHVFADSLEVTGSGSDMAGELRSSALQTSTVSEFETGAGGSIFLDVGALRVGASEPGGVPGIVAAFVAEAARGAGGSIEITGDSALLEDGGQVSTTTEGFGDAGSIAVDLTGDLVARGARLAGGFRPSGLFARGEDGSTGDAGSIDVSAANIELLDSAAISTRADGTGNSGNIDLFATGAIRVVGGFQASSVTARGLVGRAGNVTLEAQRIELLDGGIVDVSVSGSGDAGLLRVTAGELLISGQSGTGIFSSLGAETAGAGNASGIDIDVSGLVRVEQGGELNAISRGDGAAGSIDVSAAVIEFVGGSGTAASEAGADAGSLRLEASGSIQIVDGSELTVRSTNGQDAGALTLVSPNILVRDSTVTADADAFGGNIAIETGELVLERASLVALSRGEGPAVGAFTSGAVTPAGGNISIAGGAVVVNQSQIVADGFGNANGGIIDITADPWLRSGDSVLSASSELGIDGFVIVNTPYGEVTGDLAALPETFLDASSLLAEPCLARDAPSGSFAVQRLRGVTPPPDAPIPAEPVTAPAQCEAP